MDDWKRLHYGVSFFPVLATIEATHSSLARWKYRVSIGGMRGRERARHRVDAQTVVYVQWLRIPS